MSLWTRLCNHTSFFLFFLYKFYAAACARRRGRAPVATLARTHLGSPRLAQAHRGGPGRAPRAALWDKVNTTVNVDPLRSASRAGRAAGGVRVQTSARAGTSASMS